jgi:hypothetical protein
MNYSTFGRKLVLYALPVLLLGACKKDDGAREVQIRYTSHHLTDDMQPVVGYDVQKGGGPFDLGHHSALNDGVETTETWKLQPGATVEVQLSFENVWPGSGVTVPASAHMQGEILVDGKVQATADLTGLTPIGGSPYLQSSTKITIK